MSGERPRVQVFLAPGARLPEKATPGAAALDVYACLPPDLEIVLGPGDRIDVPTGLWFAIPPGYLISVRARSGRALREGMALPNAPGTIDSDYRGEFRVLVVNLGQAPLRIKHGERIAQILLERSIDFDWEESKTPLDPDATHRGAGGFGSTGLA
ncbi:MAG: dUTP diphosphatase [Leptospirales bacterium]|nr:dUTP diphosphatase [Leptospirales bacterium]